MSERARLVRRAARALHDDDDDGSTPEACCATLREAGDHLLREDADLLPLDSEKDAADTLQVLQAAARRASPTTSDVDALWAALAERAPQ